MKKVIYYDEFNRRYLVIDTVSGSLNWLEESDQSLANLNLKSAQELYENISIRFMQSKPSDIKIEKFEPNNNVTRKTFNGRSLLKIGNKNIGQIINDIYAKEIDNFNKQGGIILTSYINQIQKVLFLMPYPKKFEKNSEASRKTLIQEPDFDENSEKKSFEILTSEQNNKSKQGEYINSNGNDFIETIVKLPKTLFNEKQNDERIFEMLTKNNKYLIEVHQDLSNKMSYLNSIIKSSVEFQNNKDDYIKNLENQIQKLNIQIELLISDRKLLEQEKEKAELIAFNNFKAKLKMSRVAIEKQIDLDENFSTKDKLFSLIKTLAYHTLHNDEDIKKLLENEDFFSEWIDFSNNIDSKLQSLLDIKSDFKSINLID
ncbi:hypothetical protein EDM56_16165 [Brevibacillus fluminis]|uniref:Uncharacterized protein n=1 Tax=Brevibacillus fluminis TaxID=511487 RepID=A0A3M8DIC3_9BACL|nr:hypothetical protein [Brevibacillus fluminis]RNB87211.1 hypothetical protein EDM56_16165 [Brevibacillus fluminis]